MKTLLKTSKSFSATSFKNRNKLFNVFIKAFAIHGIQLYLTRYSFAKFCKFCIFILIFVNDVVLVFLFLALTYFAPFSSVSIVAFEQPPVYWGISIAFVFVFNAFLCLFIHFVCKIQTAKHYITMAILFRNIWRSSHPEVFLEKGVLKICSEFTGEHPCQNMILIKQNVISIKLL